jgi:hypothetical protein
MPTGVYTRTDKHRVIARRPRNGSKGGRKIVKGYVMIRMPRHPMATANGYVLEHRLVMAAHIGRNLDASEHVHHKNENRSDNHIDNLVLLSAGAHCAEHATGRKHPNRVGRQWTLEERAKLSASLTGRPKSPESIEKMRAAKRGKTRSPETIAKMRAGAQAAWRRKRAEQPIHDLQN